MKENGGWKHALYTDIAGDRANEDVQLAPANWPLPTAT